MISEYVQKQSGPNKGERYGAFAATLNEAGEIVIGHSKWHAKLDKYDPKRGMSIAVGRAEKDSDAALAQSLRKKIKPFVRRAKRYYKTDRFSGNTMKLLAKNAPALMDE